MKKISLLVLCSLFLNGCVVDVLTYRESYTIDAMSYWENRFSKERAEVSVLSNCYYKTFDNTLEQTKNRELYAECLHSLGYRFKTSSWLYCYHRRDECHVYDKYRK